MRDAKVGEKASTSRFFTFEDVKAFAALTGDYNPIHLDVDYAAGTKFKKPIVHGPLVITIVTSLFASELPGPGSVYLSHEVKYLKPVFVGEEIHGTVEVIEINENNHIFVSTICTNSGGEIVLKGIARLKKY